MIFSLAALGLRAMDEFDLRNKFDNKILQDFDIIAAPFSLYIMKDAENLTNLKVNCINMVILHYNFISKTLGQLHSLGHDAFTNLIHV